MSPGTPKITCRQHLFPVCGGGSGESRVQERDRLSRQAGIRSVGLFRTPKKEVLHPSPGKAARIFRKK